VAARHRPGCLDGQTFPTKHTKQTELGGEVSGTRRRAFLFLSVIEMIVLVSRFSRVSWANLSVVKIWLAPLMERA
jgi:hypothetical protein